LQRSRWCSCRRFALRVSLVPPREMPPKAACSAGTAAAASREPLQGASSCSSCRVRTRPWGRSRRNSSWGNGCAEPRRRGQELADELGSPARRLQPERCPGLCPSPLRAVQCAHPSTPGQRDPSSPRLGACEAGEAGKHLRCSGALQMLKNVFATTTKPPWWRWVKEERTVPECRGQSLEQVLCSCQRVQG